MTDAEHAEAMRGEGYHQCPDGVWRQTPSNGMFDGLCGVCEYHSLADAPGPVPTGSDGVFKAPTRPLRGLT